MEFWKMNGAGNDFIIIDNRDGKISDEKIPEIAKIVCERHLSIGADGMMIVVDSDVADFKMRFYNADGSMGEMCGNGARCISRYGYERGLAGNPQKIETTAGIVWGERISEGYYKVRLNDPSIVKLDEVALINGKSYHYAYVELGNPGIPHVVVPIKNLQNVTEEELFELGRELRYYPALPKGANVNFYDIVGENHLFERTWERGVEDFTYACGTGTGSLVVVLTMLGIVNGKHVQVDMRGGTLYIDVVQKNEAITDIFLTGPTNVVAKGELLDSKLRDLLGIG